jgi:hypothetical protein
MISPVPASSAQSLQRRRGARHGVASRSSVSSGACGILLFGGSDEQLPGVFCVADRSFVVEAEHGGQVKWVGSLGEGLIDLPVDAQALDGG